ncbi:hypothetical protein [Streptomyces hygroscopicus]|uniref:hypothetical protein n=1 Tax=Streptomyces hygroscopicus TaxID=1912 RepID=UPI000767911F
MPEHVRGALVHRVSATRANTFQIRWVAAESAERVPPGRVLLSWTPTADGCMDVAAHLGLPGAEVLLATWPGLTGEWSRIVHPTVVEVMSLHSALTLASRVLEMLVD